MTEILTADYRSESTEDLIKRAEQMLGDPKLYPRADDIIPYSRSGFGFMNQIYPYPPIRTLAPPRCNRIEVKNTINITDASIIVCGGAAIGTCPVIPLLCPAGVNPNDFVNMVAIADALVDQTGVNIAFDYLLNDVPTTTVVNADLLAGPNTVYCFAANTQYGVYTTLVLHGARVV